MNRRERAKAVRHLRRIGHLGPKSLKRRLGAKKYRDYMRRLASKGGRARWGAPKKTHE